MGSSAQGRSQLIQALELILVAHQGSGGGSLPGLRIQPILNRSAGRYDQHARSQQASSQLDAMTSACRRDEALTVVPQGSSDRGKPWAHQ